MVTSGGRLSAKAVARLAGAIVGLPKQDLRFCASLGTLEAEGTPRSLVVRDGRAYLAGTATGLLAIDVSDPANPVMTGGDESHPNARTVALFEGWLVLGDAVAGWVLYDLADPADPVEVDLSVDFGNGVQSAVIYER